MFVDALGVFGETSGGLALQKMYEKMLSSAEGQSVLRDKPRINTKTVNLDYLRGLAPNSFGRAYVKFLEDNVCNSNFSSLESKTQRRFSTLLQNVTPDTRTPVQFVDDIELAYVMQRYREIHDLVHTVLGMPTNMLGTNP
jgi:ubiquinone biosynthesis protein COQ4